MSALDCSCDHCCWSQCHTGHTGHTAPALTSLPSHAVSSPSLSTSHHLLPLLASLPGHSHHHHPDRAPRCVPAAGADPTVSKFSCCVLVAWCRKEWVVLSLVRLTVPHPAKSITDISCCCGADGRSSAAPPPPPRDHSAHRPATTTFGQPGTVTPSHREPGPGPVSRSKCWHRDISENNMLSCNIQWDVFGGYNIKAPEYKASTQYLARKAPNQQL